jgi:predicted RNA-binding Zn ribbon-like protein
MLNELDDDFELDGGALCLDFANTVGGSRHGVRREHLHSYADLLSFSALTGLIDGEQASSLQAEAQLQPGEATAFFQRAIDLREGIFRIFDAIALKSAPSSEDLALLNHELARGSARQRVAPHEDHYEWTWEVNPLTMDLMLGPLARSAADLLVSADLERVRECAGDNCSWLFIDQTRNHSRVWCDMKSCGNRAKVRRFRQRSTMV